MLRSPRFFAPGLASVCAVLFAFTIVTVSCFPGCANNPVNTAQTLDQKAYAVDMQGKMRVMQPKDPSMAAMKRRARAVPRGTVFFMNNGRLYMMQGSRSLFETNF